MITQILILLGLFSSGLLGAEYEIYPRPQKIRYSGNQFEISPRVTAVVEPGIDVHTRGRLEAILESHQIGIHYAKSPDRSGTTILLGIHGSGGSVDRFFKKYLPSSDGFFEKHDAHVVAVKKQVIAVLGKDSDSAFYGLSSLKHIFNQLEGRKIRELRIDDYSHVKHRGFIEGYYGNPWSNDDRAELMKFGGDYKLNTYFFAPKDDLYHNKKWRELYPPNELAEIRKLARVGNATKNKYVYALHTFMHQPIRFDSEANYAADLNIIKAKFTQLMENDVRAFSILADDAAVPPQGPQSYVKLLRDLTQWLLQKKKQYPDLVTDLPFCSNDYMGNGGSTQLKIVNQAPESVSIIMTGGRIWGEVSQSFTSTFKANISSPGSEGRPPYLWINWPCSDNSKQHLILGGNDTFLHPGVNPTNIQGIILNPMQQAEANKSALFAIADYGWKIWTEKAEADQNWHDSFKYMDHGSAKETRASTALRNIARHMINQNMDGRVRALQESVKLAPKLKAFKEKLSTGRISRSDTTELLQEFESLRQDSAFYQKNPGNPRTRDQIVHWLDCWQDTTTAAINYLQCLDALGAKDYDTAWLRYSTAQASFEKSKTHSFKYVNHFENAEVGVQHIVPFIKALGVHTSEQVAQIIDPERRIRKVLLNRSDSNDTQAVFDGDPNTGIVLKHPNRIAKGEHIGLLYSYPQRLKGIRISLGTKANPTDTFGKARLEITKDGEVWEALSKTTYQLPTSIEVSDLDLEVRGVRLIATEAKEDTWLGINEFALQFVDPLTQGYTNTQLSLVSEVSIDRATLKPANGLSLKPGQYIGLKLDRIKDLKKIDWICSNKELTLQVSCNEINWIEIKALSSAPLPDARYIRLINLGKQEQRFDLEKFVVHSNEIYPICLLNSHAPIRQGSSVEQIFDGDFNSTAIFNGPFSEGQSITFDLGQLCSIDNLKYVVLDTETDHIRDASFQLSADGQNWVSAITTNRKTDDPNAKPQDNGYFHGSVSAETVPISHAYLEAKALNTKARYIRILATKSYHPRWVRISEIVINDGAYLRSVNDPTFASTPVEVEGHGPERMIDDDLTTSYRPNTQQGRIRSGTVSYQLSENCRINEIKLVQAQPAQGSSATLSILSDRNNQWIELGVLEKSLNTFRVKDYGNILKIKIDWTGSPPTIFEIATLMK